MPTSLQDPVRAKRQREALRGSIPATDFDKDFDNEREWWGLWLGGPLLALTVIAGLIGLVLGLAELYQALTLAMR